MSTLLHSIRHISNDILSSYCTEIIKRDITLSTTADAKTRERIFQKWHENLDKIPAQNVEADMADIDDMKSDQCTQRMIQALVSRNLAPETLEEAENLGGRDRAMWFFLRYPDIFSRAIQEDVFESPSGWSMYSVPSDISAEAVKERVDTFAKELGQTLYKEELRGKQCKAEYSEYNGQICISAYPEDYSTSSIGYDTNGDINHQQKYRPVLESYAMYDPIRGILRVKTKGGSGARERLAHICSRTILEHTLDENDRIIHDLECIRNKDFRFKTSPEDRILSIVVVFAEFRYRS